MTSCALSSTPATSPIDPAVRLEHDNRHREASVTEEDAKVAEESDSEKSVPQVSG
jgi:hypothetical protein